MRSAASTTGGGREESFNVRGAYLEVWADFLGSVAVLIGAALIAITGMAWIDPLVAILIALWILPRGWQLLKEALARRHRIGHVTLQPETGGPCAATLDDACSLPRP